ncbi:MAG: phospholipase D family protein [Anaerolineae bacterium]
MSENRVSVAVTGIVWMGKGIGSIESALGRLFREAGQEIMLAAYTVSSGADLLFDWLEATLVRGVHISLIINRLDTQPPDVIARLHQLAAIYPHFHLYDFVPESETDLHAKTIVVDRRLALVGSSNLSRRGLLANHELAVLIEGGAAMDIAMAIDCLLADHRAKRVW